MIGFDPKTKEIRVGPRRCLLVMADRSRVNGVRS